MTAEERTSLIELIARAMVIADEGDPDMVVAEVMGRPVQWHWELRQPAAETAINTIENAGYRLQRLVQ